MQYQNTLHGFFETSEIQKNDLILILAVWVMTI